MSAAPSGHISQSRAASSSPGAKCSTSQAMKGATRLDQRWCVSGLATMATRLKSLRCQAEFDVVPEGARIHALEIPDDLEHPHVAVARDEGFELARDPIELLRRHARLEHDLDRLGVVVFLVGEHGLSGSGRERKRGRAHPNA